MKTFRCPCGQTLFFENTQCTACGRQLGFLPDRMNIAALETGGGGLFKAFLPDGGMAGLYLPCNHYTHRDACNWMIPESDDDPFCRACRLNQVIPNLDKPGNRELWLAVEREKRRLVYDLLRLGLPLAGRDSDPHGLAFAFLEADAGGLEFGARAGERPVLTGHQGGLITINIAEADDVERERMRVAMNELYRTLLGHFRHESGHYYFERLVGGSLLEEFRALFGDERADYEGMLARYYEQGPRPNWNQEFISAYASAHPWEDWAECWGHYLQIGDALETARYTGMASQPEVGEDFEAMITAWMGLSTALNLMNRGMGLKDAYPFVLTDPVVDKLRFVDRVVTGAGSAAGRQHFADA